MEYYEGTRRGIENVTARCAALAMTPLKGMDTRTRGLGHSSTAHLDLSSRRQGGNYHFDASEIATLFVVQIPTTVLQPRPQYLPLWQNLPFHTSCTGKRLWQPCGTYTVFNDRFKTKRDYNFLTLPALGCLQSERASMASPPGRRSGHRRSGRSKRCPGRECCPPQHANSRRFLPVLSACPGPLRCHPHRESGSSHPR